MIQCGETIANQHYLHFRTGHPGGRLGGLLSQSGSSGNRQAQRRNYRGDEFRKRLSKSTRAEDEEVEQTTDDGNWELGPSLRKKGSVHSDMWTGTAAELAERNALAVFPVTGWWRERRQLGKCDSLARYSLVVSIETEKEDVEFYVRIANSLGIEVSV